MACVRLVFFEGMIKGFWVASVALFLGLSQLSPAAFSATNITWADIAGNSDFATGTSWSGGTAPTSDITTHTAIISSLANAQPDLAADRSIFGLDFQTATGGALFTSGAGVTLTLGAGGIDATTQASGTNTVSVANLKIGAAQTWSPYASTAIASSVFNVSSNIDLNGFALTVAPGGSNSGITPTVKLSGIINDTSAGGTGTLSFDGSSKSNVIQVSGLNTFTGNVTLGSCTLNINTLADGGVVSSLGQGSGPISSTSAFNLTNFINYQAINGVGGTGGSTNRLLTLSSGGPTAIVFVNVANNGTGAISFTNTGNTVVGASGTGGTRSLALGGTNTGQNTFAQTINDLPGIGTVLTKLDGGTWVVTGTNTYTGSTSIQEGILSVTSLADSGTASNLGTDGSIGIGAFSLTGTLQYTGTGASTNRVVDLPGSTGGAIIDQSGTGLLKFTSNFTASGAGSKTLTLTGSTTGSGEIAGTIINNSGTNKTSVTKSGTGTWTLSGANTYTGTTTINRGTLELKNSGNGINQTVGVLTLAGADVTLKSNNAGANALSTTFTSLTARAAGNTANIVSTGGTNGTDNSIIITGQNTAGFIDKGVYFNGADFAAMNASGTFVRGLNYATTGGDTNTVDVNTITASKHVKLTSTPVSSQAAISLLSLHLSGSGVNWTTTSGNLTVPGIIKSGGGTLSTISGGNLTAGAGVELVVRTDTLSDLLAISSALAQNRADRTAFHRVGRAG